MSCRAHWDCPKYCLAQYYWAVKNYWLNRRFGPRWYETIQCYGRTWARFLNYKGPSWFKWFIWDFGLWCERYSDKIEAWFDVRAQRKAEEKRLRDEANNPLLRALKKQNGQATDNK